jgi:hypothetical protein
MAYLLLIIRLMVMARIVLELACSNLAIIMTRRGEEKRGHFGPVIYNK